MTLEPLARAGKMHAHKDLRDLFREWEMFPEGLTSGANKVRNRNRHHFDMLDALSCCATEAMEMSTVEVVRDVAKNSVTAAMRACKLKAKGRDWQRAYRP